MKKTVRMIGNAHLDPVWLWQWREGFQEVKATFQSALDRMEEHPDFVFTCACAGYYQWVEENDPAMFEKIQARVKEGRWAIVGGMWIQPDMNTPSGECLVRQLLYSQRYFKEKFGVTVSVGYNVDTFGHNAMAPQIYKKAGVDNYVWMRPMMPENAEIPEGTLMWEAPDGSRICTYRIPDSYNTTFGGDRSKIDGCFEMSERLGQPVMCFYGVGNHGGGPTKAVLKMIDEYRKTASRGDEVVYDSPMGFFEEMRRYKDKLPVWKTELQHHASGCYSTHSSSKKLHRQAENAMNRMEKLAVMSQALTGHLVKTVFVQQGWRNVMFNEFHDLMGGCSLPEAMHDVEIQLNETIAIADREENAALQKMSWQVNTIKGMTNWCRSKEYDWSFWGNKTCGTPIVVFNPHGFEAEGNVILRRPVKAVRDDEGNVVPAQAIRATRTNGKDKFDGIFRAKVPAMGYKLYWLFLDAEEEKPETSLKVTNTSLENGNIRAEFDLRTGALTHLIDKKTGRDALTGAARVKLMDIEHIDTWAHMVFKFDRDAGVFSDAHISILEEGPARAGLKVVSRFGASTLEQKYYLNENGDQLEVEAKLNMQEKHRMVKVCFPTAGKTDVSEIPYGALERRGNGDEENCQRWVAMQGEEGGLAVLNDSKYSYSAPDGELRLTVANSSIYADHYGQNDRDAECVYMDQGEIFFRYTVVPFAGSWKDAGLNRRAALLNQPLQHIVETYHEGPLGSEYCGMDVQADHVDVGAFKRAEDGQGYILRLSETVGRGVETKVDVKLLDRALDLKFGPFEIKTLYLPDDKEQPVREVMLTEFDW